ncbi:MAG: hypothetical protein L0G87_00595 [Renibacterium salmoninarum]|jgi:hypothetical protein|nr:hypothetical protein [Renibacterium salmoninarum]
MNEIQPLRNPRTKALKLPSRLRVSTVLALWAVITWLMLWPGISIWAVLANGYIEVGLTSVLAWIFPAITWGAALVLAVVVVFETLSSGMKALGILAASIVVPLASGPLTQIILDLAK